MHEANRTPVEDLSSSDHDAPEHDPPDSPRTVSRELRFLTWVAIIGLTVALLAALSYARAFVMPIVLGALLAVVLEPVHRVLRRCRIPSALSAALLATSGLIACGLIVTSLIGPATTWTNQLPETLRKIEDKLRPVREPLEEVTKVGARVREAASLAATPDPNDPVEVQIQPPDLSSSLLDVSGQIVGSLIATICTMFFVLAAEDRYVRKAIQVAPGLARKKRVAETIRDVQQELSRYLLGITTINVGLGLVITLAMFLAGLPNPALWGVMATLLNFLPYVGAVIGTAIVALVSVTHFDATGAAIIAPALYLACTVIEGQFVTPVVLGMRLKLDPLVIFISLFLWGWLWGVPGLVLAVPLLAAVKIIFQHTYRFRDLAEFMSK